MTCFSGRIISHSLQKMFSKFFNFFQKTFNIHRKGWTRWEFPRWILSDRVDKSRLTVESLVMELVSNAYAQLFPDNTLSSFINFLPEQLKMERQWEVAISETSYPSMYHNITVGKFMFFDKKFSKLSEICYLETGLYPSITDIVEAMNTLIQQRQNHSENCITFKVSRRTQKVEICLANEVSGLPFFSVDLGHIFGRNVGNEFGLMLRGKWPHKP